MVIRLAALLLVMSALSGCTVGTEVQPIPGSTTTLSVPSTTTSADLTNPDFDAYVEGSFRMLVTRSPQTVTELGIGAEFGMRDDRLNDLSGEYAVATRDMQSGVLDQLRSYPLHLLTEDQIATRLAYQWYLEHQLELYPYRLHEWPVHFLLTSYNQGVISLFTEVHTISNRNQVDDYIARLSRIDAQVDQVIANMRDSTELGVLPPRYVVDITIDQLQSDIADGNASQTPIFQSFELRVGELGLNRATVDQYLATAESAIEQAFTPAWLELIAYLEEIRPLTTGVVSLDRVPDGSGYYEALLSFHTSTDMTPIEVHDLGWREVDRITAEMIRLGEDLGLSDVGIGDLRSEIASDAGFVRGVDSAAIYEGIISDAYDDFAPYFHSKPTAPLKVVADPAPVAFYVGPSVDGSRPGSFHVGTGGREAPLYTMRSLAYHETVPGHHYQVALAQELDLPSPLRFLTTTGQVEGWAFYAERLAHDVGLYEGDPQSDFGRLDFELLRAARLVVDTGIHHLGWNRDEAVATMTEIMGGPKYNHEVDRYILYPGQATAYMVGMLAILEMRDELGVRVTEPESLAAFHDLIIGRGNVPLSVLQALVEAG